MGVRQHEVHGPGDFHTDLDERPNAENQEIRQMEVVDPSGSQTLIQIIHLTDDPPLIDFPEM